MRTPRWVQRAMVAVKALGGGIGTLVQLWPAEQRPGRGGQPVLVRFEVEPAGGGGGGGEAAGAAAGAAAPEGATLLPADTRHPQREWWQHGDGSLSTQLKESDFRPQWSVRGEQHCHCAALHCTPMHCTAWQLCSSLLVGGSVAAAVIAAAAIAAAAAAGAGPAAPVLLRLQARWWPRWG